MHLLKCKFSKEQRKNRFTFSSFKILKIWFSRTDFNSQKRHYTEKLSSTRKQQQKICVDYYTYIYNACSIHELITIESNCNFNRWVYLLPIQSKVEYMNQDGRYIYVDIQVIIIQHHCKLKRSFISHVLLIIGKNVRNYKISNSRSPHVYIYKLVPTILYSM